LNLYLLQNPSSSDRGWHRVHAAAMELEMGVNSSIGFADDSAACAAASTPDKAPGYLALPDLAILPFPQSS
jgi:hypothetical protein